MQHSEGTPLNFSAIRLKLASPKEIRSWSNGEVMKPETINYRTQKPEKDGLFSERIFGPAKDWECHCGKYKKIRYKGIVCDKCGVEVTRAIVRRERMAHIELAAPVSHIWFLRGVPSKMGIVLDLSVSNLEKILYFANFIILSVDEDLRAQTLEQLKEEARQKRNQIDGNDKRGQAEAQKEKTGQALADALEVLARDKEKDVAELDEAVSVAEKELRDLEVKTIISENQYRDLSLKYGHVFTAGIGGDAVYQLLKEIDLDHLAEELAEEVAEAGGAKRDRYIRRLKLIRTLIKNKIRPEWMMLTVLPVIPPDLRPMVPLDGGRFATSDLNDLYRRVINRNNRLKQLIQLNAPEVIFRNEKRMLQEAVDALIDNAARHGKTVMAASGQKRQLKSIADMLKGKQGRFRQNLLGKRTDYSGRSVIVVGPHLKFNQCGLPKKMALELFKPFIIAKLIEREIVHNVRSASRFIETGAPVVWDILEEVTSGSHVLLNRAPTLHRLGIQAFQPILIEGKAIQVHPMVCAAFNADFDGDQMAVHVPLTEEAKAEARDRMVSTKNLLKPATGDPVAKPDQDVVWGCFYLTRIDAAQKDARVQHFSEPEEAKLAYHMGKLGLQEEVAIRFAPDDPRFLFTDLPENGLVRTTVGRVIFNELFPRDVVYVNDTQAKRALSALIRRTLEDFSQEEVAQILDNLKGIAFQYLTRSGLSWGMGDIPRLPEKTEIIKIADAAVDEVHEQYETGLLTESERYSKVIEVWTQAKDEIVTKSRNVLDPKGSVFSMIDSGARGSWGQLTQIVGMKGLVTNPSGEIIELPVKGSFKDGYGVLEYFISTHGSRKGLSDTALRTANAGYLTRRLVDVAQDVVISEEDCGDTEGVVLTREESDEMGEDISTRLFGRTPLEDIKDGRKKIVKVGEMITEEQTRQLKNANFDHARIRSVLSCQSVRGLCQACYGYDLASHKAVALGTAVGIIAAQSIGEPGTQLTMRTFHTGGVVGDDITQGLPRVEELFEARIPRKKAFLAEGEGKVSVEVEQRTITDATGKQIMVSGRGQKIIKIESAGEDIDTYDTKTRKKKNLGELVMKVKDGEKVDDGTVLFIRADGKEIEVTRAGTVQMPEDPMKVEVRVPIKETLEYIVPPGYVVLVKDGEMVEKGTVLTNGSIDPHQLYKLRGKAEVQAYVLREIQAIYSSQGQRLNDKHIELISRQLFSRVHVEDAGETNMLPGEIVERTEFISENARTKEEKGELADGRELLLGISKVSLSTQSFLSAASFQETAKVLINAAITGRVDYLEGLKENVIIGRLIPAGTGWKKAIVRRKRTTAMRAAARTVKSGGVSTKAEPETEMEGESEQSEAEEGKE